MQERLDVKALSGHNMVDIFILDKLSHKTIVLIDIQKASSE